MVARAAVILTTFAFLLPVIGFAFMETAFLHVLLIIPPVKSKNKPR